MKLQTKFLSLLIILIIFGEIVVFATVKSVAEELVGNLILRYGQMISKYDTEKTLAPITIELRKVKELANNEVIKQWALTPENREKYINALSTLEQYRWKFSNNNYFVALKSNHNYYYNNSENEFADNPFQFKLDQQSKNDDWFFTTILNKEPLHINISPNEKLGIDRLWIDVQIIKNGEVLGIVGTGIIYDRIMDGLFDTELHGIDTLFVDNKKVIQLYREAGIVRSEFKERRFLQKKAVASLFASNSDNRLLNDAMKIAHTEKQAKPVTIMYKGTKHLAVVSYISELKWYEITLIDMEVILPANRFAILYIVCGAVILLLAVFLAIAIKRWVVQPISLLESKTQLMYKNSSADISIKFDNKPNDEMGLLMCHFEEMSAEVESFTLRLEEKVAERTEALERLAAIDSLTELFNRRGMEQRIKEELSHARRDNYNFGLLWLDVDHFKRINDSLGHEKGDESLRLVASAINNVTREYDSACRWGGDEFLVLIRNDDVNQLRYTAERLRENIRLLEVTSDDQRLSHLLSVSIGGTIVLPNASLKSALLHADNALYYAKEAGRNLVVMWSDLDISRHSNFQ